jgi:ribonuclease HI
MATLVPKVRNWSAKSLYAALLSGYHLRIPMENDVWHKIQRWITPRQAGGLMEDANSPQEVADDDLHTHEHRTHGMNLRRTTKNLTSISLSTAASRDDNHDYSTHGIHSDSRIHTAQRNYAALAIPPIMRQYQLFTLYNAHTTAARVTWSSRRLPLAMDQRPHVQPSQRCFFCGRAQDGIQHIFSTACDPIQGAEEDLVTRFRLSWPPPSVSRMILVDAFDSTRDLNFLVVFQFGVLQIRREVQQGYHSSAVSLRGIVVSKCTDLFRRHLKKFPDPTTITPRAPSGGSKAPSQKRKDTAQEMQTLINEAEDDDVLCFMDGSHRPEINCTGGGISVWRAGVPILRLSFALGDSTNNEAELFAIGACLELLKRLVDDGTIASTTCFSLFTDSEYSYDLIMGNTTAHTNIHLVHNIIHKVFELYSVAADFTFYWLPGHLAIDGNDDADALAKQGAADAATGGPLNVRVIDRVYHLHEHDDCLLRCYTDRTAP